MTQPDLVSKLRERFVSRDEFNDGIADEAAQSCVDWSNLERRKEALRYIVKQIWNEAITEREASTPIVPSTPDDPRFNGVVVEVAEEFAILEEDIPALRQILARLQPVAGLSAEQVALAIATNKLLPDPPGGFDMEGIAKDLNAVLGAAKPASAAILTGPDGTGIGTGINAERPAPAGEVPTRKD